MSLRSLVSTVAIALSLAVPLSAAAQATPKLAYVDYQRVLLEVDEGKAAKARLQKWLESRQKEIDREQEALRKEQELLQKQASTLSDDVRTQRATELQKKVMALGQKYEGSRAEAANKERQEMEPIVGKIDQIISRIAQRDGLGMVFEKRDSGLVFALAQLDLTNEVVRTYNSSPPAAAAKPAAAPATKSAPAKDAPVKK
jgi:outer membrane protein